MQPQPSSHARARAHTRARAIRTALARRRRCGYSLEEQQADADLGKSLREGWRATDACGRGADCTGGTSSTSGGGGRAGADAAGRGRGRRSGSVRGLLAPPLWAEMGLSDEQLLAPRCREEIAELVVAAGLAPEGCELGEVFDAAAAAEAAAGGGVADMCSLAGFMEARQRWLRQQVGV